MSKKPNHNLTTSNYMATHKQHIENNSKIMLNLKRIIKMLTSKSDEKSKRLRVRKFILATSAFDGISNVDKNVTLAQEKIRSKPIYNIKTIVDYIVSIF